MKILSKLLVASFVFCVLSLSSFAQSEKDALVKKNLECEDKGDWNCMLETAEKLIKLDPTDSAYLASRWASVF